MSAKNEGSGQLIATMKCDARLLRIFDKLKEPPMIIPEFEHQLKEIMINHHVDKGVLLSRFTGVDDYNRQLNLTSMLQHHIDAIMELNFDINNFYRKWSELNQTALRHLNSVYGNELNLYKDSVRTSIVSSVLEPIEKGIVALEYYREEGEKIQTHLSNASWTLREVNGIIREFLLNSRITGGGSTTV